MPLSEWKAWDAQWSMGAQWADADETAVFEKARSLTGHTSVSGSMVGADPAGMTTA